MRSRKIDPSLISPASPGILSGALNRVAKQYTVRPAQPADRTEIIEFFKAAYADQFNAAGYQDENKIAEKFDWAGAKNPNKGGLHSSSWICRENASNKIVGHFGVMPVSLKYKDSYLPAVWGRDLIVSTGFRKLGVGPLLVATALKESGDAAAVFLIAGVRDHVYAMYRRFGFADMGRIPLYVRINRTGPIIRGKLGSGGITPLISALGDFAKQLYYLPSRIREYMLEKKEDIRIEEIRHFGGEFDKLWKEASGSFGLIVRRDSAHLKWRFVEQPHCNYVLFKACRRPSGELAGYIILRQGETRGLGTGVITDIFTSQADRNTMAALINFAVAYFAKRDDIALIRCDVLNKDVGAELRRCGFINIPSNERFMLTNIRQDLDQAFFKERDNWFLDYADSDLDLSGIVNS